MEPRHWVLAVVFTVLILAGTRVGVDMLLALKKMLSGK
jgi:hypothetical protein